MDYGHTPLKFYLTTTIAGPPLLLLGMVHSLLQRLWVDGTEANTGGDTSIAMGLSTKVDIIQRLWGLNNCKWLVNCYG